jgi:ferric-dicitrate binding protein FerR (iron transport regulator)
MNCSQAEEKLGAYVDGELAPRDREGVDAHLAACGECRRGMEALRAQGRELDGAFQPLRRDADLLAQKIIGAVHAEPAPPRRRRAVLARATPMIAAAAAGFLVAFLIFRAPEETPREWTPKTGPPEGQSVQQTEAALPVAWLAVATGPVEVQESLTTWASCAPQGSVAAGVQVRTGPQAKCSFRWSDESHLLLNGGTEIRLVSPRSIELRRGEVYARVTERAEPFRIRTSQATFDGNNAAWNFRYEEQKGKPALGNVAVLRGSVRLLPAQGENLEFTPMLVKAGKDGELEISESPARMVLATRWIHELLRADDPEIAPRVLALLDEVGSAKGADPFDQEIRALGDRAAPGLLSVLRGGKDASRRRHAARILADIAGPAVVQELLALVEDSDREVQASCLRALPRVTGQAPQPAAAWLRWGRENPGFGLDPEALRLRREPFDRVSK